MNRTRACIFATLMAAGPALAGPSQGIIGSPGGLVSACATEISSASFTPGGDLEGTLLPHPGRYSCQSQVYAGNGQANAAATWNNGVGVNAETRGTARMGVIGLEAHNTANSLWRQPGSASHGGWSDTLTFNLPGQTGTAAVWLFTMTVRGELNTSGVGGAGLQLAHYRNGGLVTSNLAGYSFEGTDPIARSTQYLSWSTLADRQWSVDSHITFALPVTLGQPVVWGVYAHAYASQYSQSAAAWPGTSEAAFASGLVYGGPVGLLVGGQAVQGWTMSSASSHDWLQAAAVPEPGSWALMLAGAVALLARRRIDKAGERDLGRS